MTTDAGFALVAEVASVLEMHGQIRCRVFVDTPEETGGAWLLKVAFAPDSICASLEVLELVTRLRRVRDVAQMRGFAETYGIDPAKLEALLLKESS